MVMRKLQPPFRVEFSPGKPPLLFFGGGTFDQYLVLDDQGIQVAICITSGEANEIAYQYNLAVLAPEE
jgi:hypothetical protein